MLALQPNLKLFFTGSSRDALYEMFHKRRAPLLEKNLVLAPKGEKGECEIEDRALATHLASGP
ncbi:hypothetical protein [Stenotrophomonas sp.]|uniref:hypothetical protein n=1 Tax=Stenotrophomonas sp. TaxID=69392 RepID=UPI0028AB00EC|nr:hypothetical protein [Stenotrophomonas sp.]